VVQPGSLVAYQAQVLMAAGSAQVGSSSQQRVPHWSQSVPQAQLSVSEPSPPSSHLVLVVCPADPPVQVVVQYSPVVQTACPGAMQSAARAASSNFLGADAMSLPGADAFTAPARSLRDHPRGDLE